MANVSAKEILTSTDWVLTKAEVTRDGKKVFIEAKRRYTGYGSVKVVSMYISINYAKKLGVNIESATF